MTAERLTNITFKSNHKQVQSQHALLGEGEIRSNDIFQLEVSQT
jgi:hypothetical protein